MIKQEITFGEYEKFRELLEIMKYYKVNKSIND